MPALYNLYIEGLLPTSFVIIGYGRSKMTDEEFRQSMREATSLFSRTGLEVSQWDEFQRRLFYEAGEYKGETAMNGLAAKLKRLRSDFGTFGRRLFYCATPPAAFPQIATGLGSAGLTRESRIIVEKPFGSDLQSAIDLNRTVHKYFDEKQIYRIDHYLGKETVQNILVVRFANGMFEPIWNRRYVSAVLLEVAESVGIEGRAGFYEEAGAIKDIVQNHMMQLLATLGMEPPASFNAESIRDEKVKLLRSICPIEPDGVVRGRYARGVIDGKEVPGYLEEEDVAPDSHTETFVAMKTEIQNWRWAGVPIFMRTGKRLHRRATTITMFFQDAPYMLFQESGLDRPQPNHLTIRVQPDEGITITFDAKMPGPEMRVKPVNMHFDYAESFMAKPAEAYERLLHDAMLGDATLFTRADEIERCWEIVEPILKRTPPVDYPAGSWGPREAHDLVAPWRWHLG